MIPVCVNTAVFKDSSPIGGSRGSLPSQCVPAGDGKPLDIGGSGSCLVQFNDVFSEFSNALFMRFNPFMRSFAFSFSVLSILSD